MIKLLVKVVTLALVLAGVGGGVASAAAPPIYVALGDSYSSGVGTRSYLADSSACQRSALSYPSLVAAEAGYALNFRACSGAMIADVMSGQVGALTAQTSLVSISIGGNDAGFVPVLTECALPGWMSDCFGKVAQARQFVSASLAARLGPLWSTIRTRSPRAKVVVVGYPRLFSGADCSALTWFSPDEEAAINAVVDQANGVLKSSAAAAGFRFADPVPGFAGHALCDRTPWLNNLTVPTSDSFHPNATGQRSGYLAVVAPLLGASGRGVSSPVLTQLGEQQARLQAGYAHLDAQIKSANFVAPDLHTARARKAAAAAGVDLRSANSINRADRRYSDAQAHAWLSSGAHR